MSLADKALKYFNLNGATGALLAAPQSDWAPVITGIDASLSAAADLNVQIGGTKAALTVSTTNTFVLTALRKGDSGEQISITLVDPSGASQPLTVTTTVVDASISDVDIVVSLATNGASALISTVQEVIDAINASPSASKWVIASTPTNPAAAMAAVSKTQLASATPTEVVEYTYAGAGQLNIDDPEGLFRGAGGDDIRIAVSAGTLDVNVRGFWVQGVDQGRPLAPGGRPLAVAAS